MKNIFILLIIVFASCQRDPDIPDYRDEYTGSYNCTKYVRSYVYNQPPTHDTSLIQIVVEKDPDSTHKIIVDDKSVPIDESGFYNTYNLSSHTYYTLRFRNDSIYLQYGYSYMGGGSATSIVGVKSN